MYSFTSHPIKRENHPSFFPNLCISQWANFKFAIINKIVATISIIVVKSKSYDFLHIMKYENNRKG